jgi:hypothetical protein
LQNILSHYKYADKQLTVNDICVEVQSEVLNICDELNRIVERTSQNCDINVNRWYPILCSKQLCLANVTATIRRCISDWTGHYIVGVYVIPKLCNMHVYKSLYNVLHFFLFTHSSVAHHILHELGTLIMPHNARCVDVPSCLL